MKVLANGNLANGYVTWGNSLHLFRIPNSNVTLFEWFSSQDTITTQSISVHIPININNHNQETTKVSLDLEAMLKVSYVHIFLKHIIFSAKYSQLF